MKTLVIQSYKNIDVPVWIQKCQQSVREWSMNKGYDYQFMGDEIFSYVPDWYLKKIGKKFAVATDYARLILIQKALDDGFDRAIWFDADLLIFDQSLLLEFEGTCAFGQELWIQKIQQQDHKKQKYLAIKNVHNAVCVFNKGCPVLPFLIYTVDSIIARVDPDKISPQMVGPKLLTALHSIANFSLLPQVGAFSPEVLANICGIGLDGKENGNVDADSDGNSAGKALKLLKQKSPVLLQAANLCASLIEDSIAETAVEILLSKSINFDM